MTEQTTYTIGTPGTPWGAAEKRQWLNTQRTQRSYASDVLRAINKLRNSHADLFDIEQYGTLDYSPNQFDLFAARSVDWHTDLPNVLITGGVHGYETSGVHGALRFLQTELSHYAHAFNFVVMPCISPWGYETINRWNPAADDPNRSFTEDHATPESRAVMAYLQNLDVNWLAHFDLHETTDTDNSEFRPALEARDAVKQELWDIPDGFYCVGNTVRPAPDFQKAIIESVAKVTHIAEPDSNNKLIGVDIEQFGVINYPKRSLGLCAGFTDAPYVTTTEVYPDSSRVDDENCIDAQVAAIIGGLDFLSETECSLS